jgi:hypothetical protein
MIEKYDMRVEHQASEITRLAWQLGFVGGLIDP